MWGFAEVEESRGRGVEPGTRLYGYLPPSSHLLVTPADADGPASWTPRRTGRSSPRPTTAIWRPRPTPSTAPAPRTIQMLLRPLFFTSFLIDDQLADEGLVTGGPIVISSASSKTAIAAAFLLAQREGVELVGAHLARERRVRRGPRYLRAHRLLRRDRHARAGPGHLRRHRRRRRGAPRRPLALRRPARAQHGGGRHPLGAARCGGGRAARAGAGLLLRAGPRRQALPTGAAVGLESRVADAWRPFCEWIDGWLETIGDTGFEGVRRVWLEVLEGRVPPGNAHVLSLRDG